MGGFDHAVAWNEAGDAALEVIGLPRVSLRTGFAPSGHWGSLLSRVQLTEGSGAGPGERWRGAPGPDPSVAVAVAGFARCARIFVITLLSVMIATIRMVAPHAREQRVDLVDAADQLGPALPKQLVLGRIRLGGNRRMYTGALAPGFNCVVSDGIIPGRGHERLGLGPPSTRSDDRGVIAAVPDRMLSRLRQLRDHARQKLQLVDLLDIIPALLVAPTLLGMPAACPVEHFALLAVPFYPLEAHQRAGEVTRKPLETLAVAGLHHDLVVNPRTRSCDAAEDQLHFVRRQPVLLAA